MNPKKISRISRKLSLVLRHQPESIGLLLDDEGWAKVSELRRALASNGLTISREELERVVAENDKQRFRFNEHGTKIRANQGHSIAVKLNLAPAAPPPLLYHGTATRFLESILKNGLEKRKRQYVHLSITTETATAVGSRHGTPVILRVDTVAMAEAGQLFYVSDNGVWLTEDIAPQFLAVFSYPE